MTLPPPPLTSTWNIKTLGFLRILLSLLDGGTLGNPPYNLIISGPTCIHVVCGIPWSTSILSLEASPLLVAGGCRCHARDEIMDLTKYVSHKKENKLCFIMQTMSNGWNRSKVLHIKNILKQVGLSRATLEISLNLPLRAHILRLFSIRGRLYVNIWQNIA